MGIRDAKVLITGGGGGLGCAVTARFVRDGARVTVPVVGEDARRLCAHLAGLDTSIEQVPLDLTDEDDVAALFEGHHFDAVVHLVGGFAMGPLHELDLAEYRRLVELNMTTTFVTLKHAVAQMRSTGYGRIVTVASKSAVNPAAQMSAYSATKAAVLALTRCLAEECKDLDVTANCVLPTVIDTPGNRAAMGDAAAADWVSPESLADTLVYLASPEARDLRGSAMQVYGRV